MAAKKNSKTRKVNPPRTERADPKPMLKVLRQMDELRQAPQLAGRAVREPEIPLDDERETPRPIKGAVPIPASLRGPAPESIVAAAERDAEAEKFEQEIRKEFPTPLTNFEANVALRRFWAIWKRHYLTAGHKRLARFALHYFSE